MTHLEANTTYLILLQRIVLNYVRQRTSLHVLHHHPQIAALHEVRLQKVDNIRMLRLLHHQDLIDDKLLAGLGRQIHLLDGDLLARGECFGDVDVARCTTCTRGGGGGEGSMSIRDTGAQNGDTHPCPTFFILA